MNEPRWVMLYVSLNISPNLWGAWLSGRVPAQSSSTMAQHERMGLGAKY